MVGSSQGTPRWYPEQHTTHYPSLGRHTTQHPSLGRHALTRKLSAEVAKCYFRTRKTSAGVARKEIGIRLRTRKTSAEVARQEEDRYFYTHKTSAEVAINVWVVGVCVCACCAGSAKALLFALFAMLHDVQVFLTQRPDAQTLTFTPFRSGGGVGVEFALKGFTLYTCGRGIRPSGGGSLLYQNYLSYGSDFPDHS